MSQRDQISACAYMFVWTAIVAGAACGGGEGGGLAAQDAMVDSGSRDAAAPDAKLPGTAELTLAWFDWDHTDASAQVGLTLKNGTDQPLALDAFTLESAGLIYEPSGYYEIPPTFGPICTSTIAVAPGQKGYCAEAFAPQGPDYLEYPITIRYGALAEVTIASHQDLCNINCPQLDFNCDLAGVTCAKACGSCYQPLLDQGIRWFRVFGENNQAPCPPVQKIVAANCQ